MSVMSFTSSVHSVAGPPMESAPSANINPDTIDPNSILAVLGKGHSFPLLCYLRMSVCLHDQGIKLKVH